MSSRVGTSRSGHDSEEKAGSAEDVRADAAREPVEGEAEADMAGRDLGKKATWGDAAGDRHPVDAQ